jgi:hypothetical protein
MLTEFSWHKNLNQRHIIVMYAALASGYMVNYRDSNTLVEFHPTLEISSIIVT